MENSNIKKLIIAGMAVSLLASCGGGGGSDPEPVDPEPIEPVVPSYQTLNSTTGTSDIAGAAILSGGDGSLALGRETGSVDHTTQTITTSQDGTVVVSDLEGEYDYTTMYTQSYTAGGNSFDATGVGGIVTSATDVPSGIGAPTVSFTGESAAVLIQADAGYDMSGQSTVDVNFESGNVDIRMDEFITTDQTTGTTAANPISTIEINGASISGNQISGGVFSVTNGDGVVDIAGTNSTSDMQGNFFGYDADISAPDEVGGVFLQSGDNGILAGGFIAD